MEYNLTVHADQMYKLNDWRNGSWHGVFCTPFPLDLSLTAQEANNEFEIRVGSWKSFVYFSPTELHKPWHPPQQTKELPEMVCILANPLEPTPQAAVNAVLQRFIEYHFAIGFARVVQYVQVRIPVRTCTSR
jgi:hypothetical protein